ncbi:KTSC domain-containing protein [Pseudomonas soli]|nr:KTSC domain-containing protein [Pseudomonas soli]
MQMVPVRSSAISAVGYDATTRRLKITFKQGRTYDFCRVPLEVYQGLINAPSVGAYYDSVIKDRYEC